MSNRNFLLLWAAYGVSAMGDHLSEMAILQTQDALDPSFDATPLTARMSFLFFLPFFFLAPITGWLADKLPRRGVMIAADVVRFGIMLGFVSLMGLTGAWGGWGPLLPLLLIGVFAALFSPARASLLPTLIRPGQLVQANGMIAGLGIIGTMAASLIGGVLAQRYPAYIAFRLDGATFLLSAFLLAMLRPPRVQTVVDSRPARAGSSGGLLHGFRYAMCHRRILELLAVGSLIWFCGALVNSVIPAIVRDVYQGDYQDISYYRAYLGLGFILGAISITILGGALRSEITITWGLFGVAGSVMLFAISVFLPMFGEVPIGLCRFLGAVGVTGSGIFGLAVMASFNALLQRMVPNRYRGRVFGFVDICTTGSLLLATGGLGIPDWGRVDGWVGYILLGVSVLTFAAGALTLYVRLSRTALGGQLTFALNLNEVFTKFWHRLTLLGPWKIPREGAVIVTANHRCHADPLILSASAAYRPISFLVAVEYTTVPVARYLMRLSNCIPVKRDGRDIAGTKKAIRHLRAGRAMGIFIEGRIVRPGETQEPLDGVAMLALKTGAAVIPAFISGVTYHKSALWGVFHRKHAQVRFGKPVDLSEFVGVKGGRETLQAATRKIHEAILALAPGPDDPVSDQNGYLKKP